MGGRIRKHCVRVGCDNSLPGTKKHHEEFGNYCEQCCADCHKMVYLEQNLRYLANKLDKNIDPKTRESIHRLLRQKEEELNNLSAYG